MDRQTMPAEDVLHGEAPHQEGVGDHIHRWQRHLTASQHMSLSRSSPSQSPTSRSKSARDAREPALSNTIADHEASNPTLLWENSPLRSDFHTDSLEFLTLLKGGSYLDDLYSIPKDLESERGGT